MALSRAQALVAALEEGVYLYNGMPQHTAGSSRDTSIANNGTQQVISSSSPPRSSRPLDPDSRRSAGFHAFVAKRNSALRENIVQSSVANAQSPRCSCGFDAYPELKSRVHRGDPYLWLAPSAYRAGLVGVPSATQPRVSHQQSQRMQQAAALLHEEIETASDEVRPPSPIEAVPRSQDVSSASLWGAVAEAVEDDGGRGSDLWRALRDPLL